MEISDQELRAMVRGAILRHGRPASPIATSADSASAHASHGRLALATGGDSEGRCLIEPEANCTHCGYCLSMGH